MPKALVIAGTSFIGRHVCDHLQAIGCEVVATSRRAPVNLPVECITCELTDRVSVEAAIRNSAPDWIIQCGGATSSRDPRELYLTHVDGTLNVLEAAREFAPSAAICLFGSAAEYGPVAAERLPVSEDCPCQPTTFFGASKLAQTHLAQAAAATNNQQIVIVRPFNVIGPGLPDFYFASSLARRLLKLKSEGAPPGTLFDVFNADSTRDFIDVRDVAGAVSTLLRGLAYAKTAHPQIMSGDVFNLATGIETPLLNAATLLGELAGGYEPQPAGAVESRGGIVRSIGDTSKLRQTWTSFLGTSSPAATAPCFPQFSWQTSIRDMWSFMTKNV